MSRRLRFSALIKSQIDLHGPERFAVKSGVCSATLYRLRRGGVPKIDVLHKLCAAANMSPEPFIEEFGTRIILP